MRVIAATGGTTDGDDRRRRPARRRVPRGRARLRRQRHGHVGGRRRAHVRRCSSTTADPAPARWSRIDVATSAARMEPRMRERRIAVKRAVGPQATQVGGRRGGRGRPRRRRPRRARLGAVRHHAPSTSRAPCTADGATLDAVVDDLDGANVLRVDTEAAERRLEAIPWVDDARVTTDFPHGAKIEIRERRPMIAYQGADGRFRVLDRQWPGARRDRRPAGRLPRARSSTTARRSRPVSLAPAGYRAAAILVSALTPQMRQRATSVSVRPECDRLVVDARRRNRGPLWSGRGLTR